MNTDKHEKSVKELFIGKCWDYLDKNFSKFSQPNKIKIALELCKKDIPTQLGSTPEFANLILTLLSKPDLPNDPNYKK